MYRSRFASARRMLILLAAVLLGISACSPDDDDDNSETRSPGTESGSQPPSGSTQPPSPEASGTVQQIAGNLEAPWGLAFLPNGEALVTERDAARILRVSAAGEVAEVAQLDEVDPSGEGGLLGIAVSPSYVDDGLVYVYYTASEDNRIARFRLGDDPEPILTGIPKASIHNGGRIAFGPDGLLYAGTGDASESGQAQDRDSLGGKILRMTAEGQPAPGNPFGTLVYSFGHRNVQGLAWNAAGQLYATEFGQNEFDELNRIEPGGNYGWPEAEGESEQPEFINPLVTWSPAEASPSGMAITNETAYIAALRGERLWRVPLTADGDAGEPEALLEGDYGRLRHAALAPDGTLWILTSNRDGRGEPTPEDDRILRFTP